MKMHFSRLAVFTGLNLWTSAEFQSKVIDALHKAVKDADPTAKTTTMLDTDVSKEAYMVLNSGLGLGLGRRVGCLKSSKLDAPLQCKHLDVLISKASLPSTQGTENRRPPS